MIGLDTNVVLRFIAQDDEVQSPIATRFISRLSRSRPGFISAVVLAEITWVLADAYKASREDIAKAVEGFLRSTELTVENAEAAWRALAAYQASPKGRFADALIAQTAVLAGVEETVTFGKNASAAFGMRLLR